MSEVLAKHTGLHTSGKIRPRRAKSLMTFALLTCLIPITASLTGIALMAGVIASFIHPGRRQSDPMLTVLVSGGKMTKALHLARAFHAAGHRVVLTETERYRYCAHRFSNAVDAFHVMPEPGSKAYGPAMETLVLREGVDVFVPVSSPASSVPEAQIATTLPGGCQTLHLDLEAIEEVDDKERFAIAARSLGLRVPKSIRITDPAQVETFDFSDETRPFILKSIAYDPLHRLDLTPLPIANARANSAYIRSLPISSSNPWVLQEYIEGDEFCTHGTAVDGKLTAYCCCASSPFQINYEHLNIPEIQTWVEHFVEGRNLTGQVSFDFIRELDTGEIFAIECNPRTHSAITLFTNFVELSDAYLSNPPRPDTLLPPAAARPTYWIAHEIWRLGGALVGQGDRRVGSIMATLLGGRDAVFQWRDPIPFFALHHVHIPSLILRAMRTGQGWMKIDFNIGKLVQRGGD